MLGRLYSPYDVMWTLERLEGRMEGHREGDTEE
jgi:hypothetical protein